MTCLATCLAVGLLLARLLSRPLVPIHLRCIQRECNPGDTMPSALDVVICRCPGLAVDGGAR